MLARFNVRWTVVACSAQSFGWEFTVVLLGLIAAWLHFAFVVAALRAVSIVGIVHQVLPTRPATCCPVTNHWCCLLFVVVMG